MLGKRRRDAGDRSLRRLKDTVARLVCFTIVTRTRRGRTKTSAIRVLTTLLDPDAFPAAEIAALYAARWQVEVGHRCCPSSWIGFSRLSSLSFYLCFSGFGLGRRPAGAVVVAGRAVPALAELG